MKYIFIACAILFSLPISAQNWVDIGNFNHPVKSFYNDSVTGEFILAGNFSKVNSDTIMGVARWDGNIIASYGCGLGWDCSTPFNTGGTWAYIASVVRYNSVLYATGWFTVAEAETINSLAYWDGISWKRVGSGLKYEGGSIASANGLKVIDNELYVFGGPFDSVAGVAANSLAKYNGTSWSTVNNFPHITIGNTDYIYDIIKYNNELYVAGNFLSNSYPSDSIKNIIRWDGSQWKSVGGGMHGGMDEISTMVIYNNELYVGGTFVKAHGNIGNYIQKWNGTEWSDVGGGVLGAGGGNGQINKLIVNNGKLYAVGVFQTAGGVTAQYIAYWDGINWCGLGSAFNNIITAVGFYKDTLYVGGGFTTIDGVSINRVAKWIGGNYVDTCGNLTGITEVIKGENSLSVYPNPTNGNITLSAPIKSVIEILNIEGRILKTYIITELNTQIDVADFASGVYFVKAKIENGIVVKKFIKL
ncbi:MAG: T9SS type A sorting domain-containing protein [Bacteroidetes bacterium]|nr:T9SS type A sorting domain-containing protein [Bacteroidota bacterium]